MNDAILWALILSVPTLFAIGFTVIHFTDLGKKKRAFIRKLDKIEHQTLKECCIKNERSEQIVNEMFLLIKELQGE
tara:strand:+ start:125 stop:352 length:228 start_codon:yes stop_codon:yes gene_type:complete